MQTLSFQAPEDLSKKLALYAKELDRSKGYLIRHALEDYLEEIEDYLEAKQYKAKYNPKENISFEEIKRQNNLL
jgi:RHH-type rel operon transcriptional repressor/antitoxin RelB